MLKRIVILFVILLITISKTTILCDDTDFQDVCLEYANNISAKFNTSLKFVDLKAENPYMQAHKWAKISYIHLSTKPELPHKLPSTRIVEIFQEWFDNPGRFEETTTLSVIHEANYTFELQTSEAFKNSQKELVNLTMLDSSSEKITLNTEIDFSNLQRVTISGKMKWKIEENIVIPAQKSVFVKFVSNIDNYEDHLINSEIHVDGFIGIWFKNQIDLDADPSQQKNKHWLWCPPSKDIFSSISKKNYKFNDEGKPIYKISGKINGKAEAKPTVIIEVHDLRKEKKNEMKFLE